MATIKSYTDIEQSKKLAEILPLESADMYYRYNDYERKWHVYDMHDSDEELRKDKLSLKAYQPCWSLAVLEHIIWNTSVDATSCPHIYRDIPANGYYVLYGNYETRTCSSMVDACYEMVLKLHELNLF